MPRYVISLAAERDMESILAWTHERFGEEARLRYEALLVRGIVGVAEDAGRTGCLGRPEIAPNARTYHLWHSRDRVEPASDRVRSPRHFLLFRIGNDGAIEIGRVLHEAMDLMQHLLDEYGREGAGEG